MSHTSPASYLVWSTMSGLLMTFLFFHLWSFDRFRCLKWNNGPYSGAFKRVMTYSYLLSVPLIFTYAVGFAVIKYREGFIQLPELGILPKPYQLWDPKSRSAIFPLMLVFSFGWSLEMVTHLEELCFWLFLVNAGTGQQDWFHSLYFKTWIGGSTVALIYMPLIAIFTRSDVLRSEAYIFLAGSLGSLSLTLWFIPVLWMFPAFLLNLRKEGVDINTIVRLTKFHELNAIRVVFRFLFVSPFIILGIDGLRPHVHINENMMWTDFLTVIAGFGSAVSSAITLVIFFPRDVEGEIAARDAAKKHKKTGGFNPGMLSRHHSDYSQSIDTQSQPTYLLTSSPVKQNFTLPTDGGSWDDTAPEDDKLSKLPPLRPNRRVGNDIELGGMDRLTEVNISKHNLNSSPNRSSEPSEIYLRPVNPFVHTFTSPIDIGNIPGSAERLENGSRLTFTRRR